MLKPHRPGFDRSTGMRHRSASAITEWKAHWPLVLASTVGVGFGGIHIYSLGAFIIPLSHDFGWSRAQITSGLTIVSLFSIACSAFVGILIDRIGPRRVAIPGIMAFGAAVALLSLTGSAIWNWWLLWIMIAASIQLAKATVWTTAVATRFTRGRGLAIACALSGAGISAALTPPYATFLIGALGWRSAYIVLALSWGTVTLLLTLLLFNDASSRPNHDGETTKAPLLPGADLRTSFLSGQFLALGLAAFFSAVTSLALLVHFIPMMVAVGLDGTTAAALAGLIGLFSAAGRLGIGFLFDRFSPPLVGGIAFTMPAISCAMLLMFNGSTIEAAVIAACIGLAIGAETDVMAYLTANRFGLRHFGAIFGMLMGILSGATGVGPLMAGAIFDRTGSYAAFLVIGIPLSLIAAVLILLLRRFARLHQDEGLDPSHSIGGGGPP